VRISTKSIFALGLLALALGLMAMPAMLEARNENADSTGTAAATDGMPGQLVEYRIAVIESIALDQQMTDLTHALVRLHSLSPEETAAEFPNGGHDRAIGEIYAQYLALTQQAQRAEATRQDMLLRLTGGKGLSEKDLAALHRMLGF